LFHERLRAIMQRREGRRHLFPERHGGGGFFVNAHGGDDEAARGIVGMELRHRGKRRLARRAPRRPEVHEHDLAVGYGQSHAGEIDDTRRREGGK
jgi:hypothetical protein